jgi:hypothetical protein
VAHVGGMGADSATASTRSWVHRSST